MSDQLDQAIDDQQTRDAAGEPQPVEPTPAQINDARWRETTQWAPVQDHLTASRQIGHAWDRIGDFIATHTAAGRAAGFEDAMVHSFLGYVHPTPFMVGLKRGLSELLSQGAPVAK